MQQTQKVMLHTQKLCDILKCYVTYSNVILQKSKLKIINVLPVSSLYNCVIQLQSKQITEIKNLINSSPALKINAGLMKRIHREREREKESKRYGMQV